MTSFFPTRRFLKICLLSVGIATIFSHTASAQSEDNNEEIKAAETKTNDETFENFPGVRKFYKDRKFTFVPIPIFATMPDEGQTYGLMPTMLVTSKSGTTMKTVVSPMVGWNSLIKTMGTMAVVVYPTKNSTLSLFGGAAQEFYQEYEIIYTDKKAFDDNIFIEASSRFYNDPFGRFFGLGPTTTTSNKTYYSATTYKAYANIAYNFSESWRLGILENFYYVNLKDPINGRAPETQTTYGPSQAVFDNHNLTNSLYLSFNSHGFIAKDTPFARTEARGAFLFSTTGMGSQSSFTGVDISAKQTFSYGPNRAFSTVLRVHYKQLEGDGIPFFEMPSLGGPNELRGYTAGRFVDKGAIIFQLEQRNKLAHYNFFKRTGGDIYLDPFFDLGQVFHTASNVTVHNMQPVGGLGVRFQMPPDMLARVDIGFSREEKFVVFTTLNYPF